jgi:hypothetical protein
MKRMESHHAAAAAAAAACIDIDRQGSSGKKGLTRQSIGYFSAFLFELFPMIIATQILQFSSSSNVNPECQK